MKNMLSLIFVYGTLLWCVVSSAQEPQTMPITWSWTPASSGTPVVFYEGEIWVVNPDAPADTTKGVWRSATNDTTFTTQYTAGTLITVNVRGVDDREVKGPYSEFAEWFIFYGTPGALSMPVFIKLGDEPLK